VNTVEDAGYTPTGTAATNNSRPESILQSIRDSNVVIADITGSNKNVIYEVGLSQGLGKPVLLITKDLDTIPTPLRQSLVLKYEPKDPQELRKSILGWLDRAISRNTWKRNMVWNASEGMPMS
jgi:nucleoside 2-deoxyribosyltransferase